MAELKPQLPPNIREFNEITGVIFAQLYEVFPIPMNIEPDPIARTLGRLRDGKLESGRSFNEVFSYTVGWVASEGFTRSSGTHPRLQAYLTTKALAAMNAVPDKLHQPIGSEITAASKAASDDAGKRKLAELIGTLFGSFAGSVTKSLSSG